MVDVEIISMLMSALLNALKRSEWAAGSAYLLFPGDFTGDGIDDLLLYTPGVSAYEWVFNPDASRSQLKVG